MAATNTNLVTWREVADLLGIKQRTFWCRVANKSGKLRAIKSGEFSLIMRDLERRRVEKDERKSVF